MTSNIGKTFAFLILIEIVNSGALTRPRDAVITPLQVQETLDDCKSKGPLPVQMRVSPTASRAFSFSWCISFKPAALPQWSFLTTLETSTRDTEKSPSQSLNSFSSSEKEAELCVLCKDLWGFCTEDVKNSAAASVALFFALSDDYLSSLLITFLCCCFFETSDRLIHDLHCCFNFKIPCLVTLSFGGLQQLILLRDLFSSLGCSQCSTFKWFHKPN